VTAAPRPVIVLVCGEPRRGDDAAAFAATSAAVDLLSAGIRGVADIRPVGALDVDDIASVGEGAACLIVDAAVGPDPGAIVLGSLASLARSGGDGPAPRSTHAMPADQVLGLAAIVRPGLPPGSFVGIGGASFGLGEGLSLDVERALPRFARAIAAEIERLTLDEASV
jgi:hydrogenase maturation protease